MQPPESKRYLVEASLSARTVDRYRKAVLQFLDWCDSYNLDPSSPLLLDDAITNFIHFLYESGRGKALAQSVLYGIHFYIPQWKQLLPLAAKAITGWDKRSPSQSYPPLTWDLAVLIAVRLARSASFAMGVGLLLAFDCFLRLNELTAISSFDISDTSEARLGSQFQGMHIRLAATKTGREQSVRVNDPAVESLVRQLLHSRRRKPFPFSAEEFRRCFHRACDGLHLPPGFVPHSLRHGGATMWFLQGRSMEDIMHRGRWSSSKTARRYVQAGRALLIKQNIPAAVKADAALLSRYVLRAMALTQ